MKKKDRRWDVGIVDTQTMKIVSVIGTDMSEEKAEKRIETGVMRVNIGPYIVSEYPTGTAKVGDKLPKGRF